MILKNFEYKNVQEFEIVLKLRIQFSLETHQYLISSSFELYDTFF